MKDGQAIGVGAGQQSRIHCTRLAGNKADIWYLRQHPKVLSLPFKQDIRRPDRDNTIDVYISDDYMMCWLTVIWEQFFTVKPEPLSREEKKEWLKTLSGVALAPTLSSPLATTSNELIAAASITSPRPAVRSATTMSSKRVR